MLPFDGGITWKDAIIFAVFGMGPSWIAVDLDFIQVPYFERVLPEEYCIAAYITLTVSMGAIFPLLVFLHNHFTATTLPHKYTVPFTCCMSICTVSLMSALWNVQIAGRSWALYFLSVLAGGVGGLLSVLVMPFLSGYHADTVTSVRCGTQILSIISAIIVYIQQPGSPSALFGPSTFFAIFAVILIVPLFAYRHIINSGICKKPEKAQSQSPEVTDKQVFETMENPLNSFSSAADSNTHTQDSTSVTVATLSVVSSTESVSNTSIFQRIDAGMLALEVRMGKCLHSAVVATFPCSKGVPWLEMALPYIFALAVIDFNSFGVNSSLAPIALKNASNAYVTASRPLKDAQNMLLQYVYIAKPLVQLAATIATYWPVMKIRYAMLLYSLCCIFIYIFSVPTFDAQVGTPIENKVWAPLICTATVLTFGLGVYSLTLVWRSISNSDNIPNPKHREACAATIGYVDQVSALAGAGLALALTPSRSCH